MVETGCCALKLVAKVARGTQCSSSMDVDARNVTYSKEMRQELPRGSALWRPCEFEPAVKFGVFVPFWNYVDPFVQFVSEISTCNIWWRRCGRR